jgi:hypothetical protein
VTAPVFVVTRNNAVSAPQSVSMVSSLPSVFTQSQTGQGLGAIIILHPDGSWVLAGNGNSATAGDTNLRTVAGFPATASPLLWAIDQVTLAAGLFQVNATLPTGIAPSPQAPVVLSQGGGAFQLV